MTFSEKAKAENNIICPLCGGEVEFDLLEQYDGGKIGIDVTCLEEDCGETSTYYFRIDEIY